MAWGKNGKQRKSAGDVVTDQDLKALLAQLDRPLDVSVVERGYLNLSAFLVRQRRKRPN